MKNKQKSLSNIKALQINTVASKTYKRNILSPLKSLASNNNQSNLLTSPSLKDFEKGYSQSQISNIMGHFKEVLHDAIKYKNLPYRQKQNQQTQENYLPNIFQKNIDESIQQADSPKSMNNLSLSNQLTNKKNQLDFTNESLLQSSEIYNSKPLLQLKNQVEMTNEEKKVFLLQKYMQKLRNNDKRHDRNHEINQMNLKLAQFQAKNEKIELNHKLQEETHKLFKNNEVCVLPSLKLKGLDAVSRIDIMVDNLKYEKNIKQNSKSTAMMVKKKMREYMIDTTQIRLENAAEHGLLSSLRMSPSINFNSPNNNISLLKNMSQNTQNKNENFSKEDAVKNELHNSELKTNEEEHMSLHILRKIMMNEIVMKDFQKIQDNFNWINERAQKMNEIRKRLNELSGIDYEGFQNAQKFVKKHIFEPHHELYPNVSPDFKDQEIIQLNNTYRALHQEIKNSKQSKEFFKTNKVDQEITQIKKKKKSMQENDDVKQLMKDLKIANLKHQNSQERKELPSSFHEESELLNKNRFKIKSDLLQEFQKQFKQKQKQSELDIMKSNLQTDTISKIIDQVDPIEIQKCQNSFVLKQYNQKQKMKKAKLGEQLLKFCQLQLEDENENEEETNNQFYEVEPEKWSSIKILRDERVKNREKAQILIKLTNLYERDKKYYQIRKKILRKLNVNEMISSEEADEIVWRMLNILNGNQEDEQDQTIFSNLLVKLKKQQ